MALIKMEIHYKRYFHLSLGSIYQKLSFYKSDRGLCFEDIKPGCPVLTSFAHWNSAIREESRRNSRSCFKGNEAVGQLESQSDSKRAKTIFLVSGECGEKKGMEMLTKQVLKRMSQ